MNRNMRSVRATSIYRGERKKTGSQTPFQATRTHSKMSPSVNYSSAPVATLSNPMSSVVATTTTSLPVAVPFTSPTAATISAGSTSMSSATVTVSSVPSSTSMVTSASSPSASSSTSPSASASSSATTNSSTTTMTGTSSPTRLVRFQRMRNVVARVKQVRIPSFRESVRGSYSKVKESANRMTAKAKAVMPSMPSFTTIGMVAVVLGTAILLANAYAPSMANTVRSKLMDWSNWGDPSLDNWSSSSSSSQILTSSQQFSNQYWIQDEDSSQEDQDDSFYVSLASDAVNPSKVQVSPGDSVTFLNTDSASRDLYFTSDISSSPKCTEASPCKIAPYKSLTVILPTNLSPNSNSNPSGGYQFWSTYSSWPIPFGPMPLIGSIYVSPSM